ncbi:ABC transporter substrate-binding protein [Celeribacter persicus]|nr:ABC transporter substrate-binding protein [Celeribacter persicus]
MTIKRTFAGVKHLFQTEFLKPLLIGFAMSAGAWPIVAGDMTIAISGEPTTLDPQKRDDGSERAVNDNIYETLMRREADGMLVPGLAAAMPEQIDDLTWQFVLRPGITFHNGQPLVAEDVVASVLRIIDPDYNSEQVSYFSTIVSAEAVDPLTVQIKTATPDPILPARMYWMKILSATYMQDAAFDTMPMGTGPYKLTGWTHGESITLARNETYWGAPPQIDSVTYRFIPEPGTQLSGLMAGELDLISNLYPEFAEAVPQAITSAGMEAPLVVLSTENPVMNDPRVRRALNLAVDRATLADSLFVGHAVPAKGQVVNPKSFGFNAALPGYSYDPEQAKALIEEAGAVGQTITFVGESGRWLKDRELIEAVGAYWSEAGLTVDIQIEEFGEYLNRLFDKETRPDAIFVSTSDELFDADRPLSAILEYGASYASNADEEMAAQIRAGRSETDMEKRHAIYDAVTQKAFNLDYLVPLLNLENIYGVSSRLDWSPRIDGKLIVQDMSLSE